MASSINLYDDGGSPVAWTGEDAKGAKGGVTAKAFGYVSVSGGVPTLGTNLNVNSITDNGVGVFTANLGITLTNTEYIALANSYVPNYNTSVAVDNLTTTTVKFWIGFEDVVSYSDPESFQFAIFE